MNFPMNVILKHVNILKNLININYFNGIYITGIKKALNNRRFRKQK